MTITCEHCFKKLKLSDKIRIGIQRLTPGQTLRLPCPQCKKLIVLENSSPKTPPPATAAVKPPSPPDITWLRSKLFTEDEDIVEDIPQALVLLPTSQERDKVAISLESIGYQANFAESEKEAMQKMQFRNFASVIFHSNFEKDSLSQSPFHRFMCDMAMFKRRFIFYILVGPDFSTLYDLQALANSANLVINDKELPELLTILRQTIPKYEELFGTLMTEINAYGG